jgi:hypothetical protein
MPSWFVVINKRKIGPVSSRVLRQLAKAGCVQPDSVVRQESAERWFFARKVRGLEFGPITAPPRVLQPAPATPSDHPIAISLVGGAASASDSAIAHDAEPRDPKRRARRSIVSGLRALPLVARIAIVGGIGFVTLTGLIVFAGVVLGIVRAAGGDRALSPAGDSGAVVDSASRPPRKTEAVPVRSAVGGSATPAGSLSGRSGDFEFTLISYDFRDSLLSTPPLTPVEYAQTVKPTGHFLVLTIEVKNLGDGPETVDAAEVFSLRDSQGRKFGVSQEGREALSIQNREILLFKSINPRMAVRATVPFDVPSKEAFEVVASAGAFAGKAVLNIDLLMEKDRAAEVARLKKVEERGKLRAEAMEPGKVLATYAVTADVPLGPGKLRDDVNQLPPDQRNRKTWPRARGSGTIELTEGGVRISGFSQPADIPEYISYNRFFPFMLARNRESSVPGPNCFAREIEGGFLLAPGSKVPPTTNMTIENSIAVLRKFPEALDREGPRMVVSFASIEECDAFLAAVQQAYATWAQRFPMAAADERFGTPENDMMDSMRERQ